MKTPLSSFLVLLQIGCTDPGSGHADSDAGMEDAAPPSPSCIEAQTHSDLEWIQANVFDRSCAAFAACHMGAATSAGGLNLEAGTAQDALVDIDSTRFTDWKLVVPGAPDNSYLMVILGDQNGPLAMDIGTMPYNSSPLCEPKLQAIRRWISSLGVTAK